MFANLRQRVRRLYEALDRRATKLLGATVGLVASADLTSIADPLKELIGNRGFDVALIVIALATYARGHVTGARYEALKAEHEDLKAQLAAAQTGVRDAAPGG
jgi:diphthamide synthase subunit DPH2